MVKTGERDDKLGINTANLGSLAAPHFCLGIQSVNVILHGEAVLNAVLKRALGFGARVDFSVGDRLRHESNQQDKDAKT